MTREHKRGVNKQQAEGGETGTKAGSMIDPDLLPSSSDSEEEESVEDSSSGSDDDEDDEGVESGTGGEEGKENGAKEVKEECCS